MTTTSTIAAARPLHPITRLQRVLSRYFTWARARRFRIHPKPRAGAWGTILTLLVETLDHLPAGVLTLVPVNVFAIASGEIYALLSQGAAGPAIGGAEVALLLTVFLALDYEQEPASVAASRATSEAGQPA